MSAIGNIKDFITIKTKSRADNPLDQYHRMIKPRIYMVISLVFLGLWLTDKINCSNEEKYNAPGSYTSGTCVTRGFYIYQEMLDKFRYHSGFYGIPDDLTYDGVSINGELCSMKKKYNDPKSMCKPMKKIYFRYHIFLPWFIMCLAPISFLPYILYKFVAKELVSLRREIKCEDEKAVKGKPVRANFTETLYEEYFITEKDNKRDLLLIAGMFTVKIAYILCDLTEFIILHYTFDKKFIPYGHKWVQWTRLPHDKAYDLTYEHMLIPGEELIPSHGLCEFPQISRGGIHSMSDEYNKLACELSPHVVYQYGMLIIWFSIIIGICIGVIDVVLYVVHIASIARKKKGGSRKFSLMHQILSIREILLLDAAKKESLDMFKKLSIAVRDKRSGKSSSPHGFYALDPISHADGPKRRHTRSNGSGGSKEGSPTAVLMHTIAEEQQNMV